MFHFRNLSKRYLGVHPLVVGDAGTIIRLENRLDNPAEAGADDYRLLEFKHREHVMQVGREARDMKRGGM